MRRLPTAATLTILSAALAATTALAAAPALSAGHPAPDFALKRLAGSKVRLSELRGAVVMINFWATWCGPCRQEMPLLDLIYKSYHGRGFDLLGVNIDDVSSRGADMARTLGVSFPVLFDDAKNVSRMYSVNTMPLTVLIGRDGTVRYVHQGYENGYEQTYLDQVRGLLKECAA